ncbi:MAG TPA: twin-arginine translocase TatA/TatE family subunit [Anseongella sp.]|nr:twin-arginine translocase TatA/TatE family subunit [Anseongella sp.]
MGTQEIMMIGLTVLLLFGGKKIPELMRGLGKGMKEFKDASSGVREEIQNTINSIEDKKRP